MNILEGNSRVGRDRLHFFRTAAGSAAEVRACVDVGMRWGEIDAATAGRILPVIARELAILRGLTRD